MEKNNLQSRIIALIERERRPLDINYIAGRLGIHWFTVYKAIADMVLDELQEHHRDVLYNMPVVPLKSTKSLVITPRSMFVKEAATE